MGIYTCVSGAWFDRKGLGEAFGISPPLNSCWFLAFLSDLHNAALTWFPCITPWQIIYIIVHWYGYKLLLFYFCSQNILKCTYLDFFFLKGLYPQTHWQEDQFLDLRMSKILHVVTPEDKFIWKTQNTISCFVHCGIFMMLCILSVVYHWLLLPILVTFSAES